MRSPQLKHLLTESPRLSVVHADELSLSGPALLELMRAVLARGVPFRFKARGWSMAPFIRDGDIITVAPLPQNRPGVGQVVAFIRPQTESLVVHRVVAQRDESVFIQGDSVEDHSDGLISLENLLGQVTHIERDGRKVWLSLGPERFVIAWLSRTRLLIPLRVWLAALRKYIRGRN